MSMSETKPEQRNNLQDTLKRATLLAKTDPAMNVRQPTVPVAPAPKKKVRDDDDGPVLEFGWLP